MGIAKLEGLARCGGDGMNGAVSALLAELTATRWRNETDFEAHFPSARRVGRSMRIPMGEAHCVELKINYDAGMIMIAFAGATEARRESKTTGRRAA